VLQRQLAGFRRIALGAGQEGTATISIDARTMSSVDRTGTRRILPGTYRLWVGGGQPGDAPGSWASFTVTGDAMVLPK
jgi:beta-glucosidase